MSVRRMGATIAVVAGVAAAVLVFTAPASAQWRALGPGQETTTSFKGASATVPCTLRVWHNQVGQYAISQIKRSGGACGSQTTVWAFGLGNSFNGCSIYTPTDTNGYPCSHPDNWTRVRLFDKILWYTAVRVCDTRNACSPARGFSIPGLGHPADPLNPWAG